MISHNQGILKSPLVNAWTEWGELEYCLVGQVHERDCVFENEPNFMAMFANHSDVVDYINYPVGERNPKRIKLA